MIYAGWIVAGDTVTNDIQFDCNWHDEVDIARTGSSTLNDSASVVAVGPKPTINKQVAPDSAGAPGTYATTANATVGDTLWFRVRFNTGDGVNPLVSGVQYANVDVVDWIPQGTAYVAGSSTMTYSNAAHFHYSPPTVNYTSHYADQPQAISSGTLNGYAWSLGNVDQGGWWQVEFKVVVQDQAAVANAAVVYDYGKLDWEDSGAMQKSDRSIASITYKVPNLTVAKARVSTSTPLGPDADVNYRLTVTNTDPGTGTTTARNIVATDTLPAGMRTFDPVTNPAGVINVWKGPALLTRDTDYTVSYVPATGVLTFDFDNGGAINTTLPPPPAADNFLRIEYKARVDHDQGAARSLLNTGRATWSCAREGVTPNRNFGPVSANTTLTLPTLTNAKAITAGATSSVGQTASYRITITVPANSIEFSPALLDTITRDGLEYVPGSTVLADSSGTPVTPARFTGGSTTADPSINWTVPNPGSTLTWAMDSPVDNRGQAVAYVFTVSFQVKVTGLVTPVSQGGNADDPNNWNWWPSRPAPYNDPTANNTAGDTGRINWNDLAAGGTARNAQSAAQTTTVQQPYLVLTKTNDHEPPVQTPPGTVVNYTVSIVNNGKSTSYKNIVTDTLPDGMRGAAPTLGTVTLNGAPLTAGTNFLYSWAPASGVQGFDFFGAPTPTDIPATQTLVIHYSATVDNDVGSGSTLANVSYTTYNPQSAQPGRQVDAGDDPTGNNDDGSSVQVINATLSKTTDAPGNEDSIGRPYHYTISTSVPAHTIIYNSSITDNVPDGLQVDGTSRFIDGTPTVIGAVTSTYNPGTGITNVVWDMGDYTNNTGSAQVLSLEITVTPKTTFHDGSNVRGIAPRTSFANSATVAWDDADVGGTHHSATGSAPNVTVQEPHLVLAITNNTGGAPVAGAQQVGYTMNVQNIGTGTSYKNTIVNTVPEGMRGSAPVIDGVTLGGVALVENVDYWLTWDAGTGAFTIDLDNGTSKTNIQTGAGSALVIDFHASVDSGAGAGATLTDLASIGYNSWSGTTGRQTNRTADPADDQTADTAITVRSATVAKTTSAPGNAAAIARPFTYTIATTVPAHTTIFNASVTDVIEDGLAIDSAQRLLDGAPSTVGSVSQAGGPGDAITVTWDMGDYTNPSGSDQVLSLVITVHIKTLFAGGDPISGLPPQDAFNDTGSLAWDDADTGGAHHTTNATAPVVTAQEPHLLLSEANDAVAPVSGGQAVHYTLTAANDGTSASCENVLVQTFPEGMRGNTPAVTGVTVGGVALTEGIDYWVTWDAGTGQLTIDLDHGSSRTNIPAGQSLVVSVTASASDDAGPGSTLTDISSIGYNSWTDGSGRRTDRTSDPADANTAASSIEIKLAVLAKTVSQPGNAPIGTSFTYNSTVQVPAHTTVYNAQLTDLVVDGIAIQSLARNLDGSPTSVGTLSQASHAGGVLVTWDLGDYTNSTGSAQMLELVMTVHIATEYPDSSLVRGLPPQDTFSNTADFGWDDANSGGGHHSATSTALEVTACEPHLVLTETNDAAGPVTGGQAVHYTITTVNDGTSTSLNNQVLQTFPKGMRGNTPTVTGVTLAGVPLVEDVDYWVSWNATTGELTIDLDHGSSKTNIAVGSTLVVNVTASASDDAGAAATLTDISSIRYDSSTSGNGRQTPWTTDPADDNTATTSITVQAAAFNVSENVVSNEVTIGTGFQYTTTVTVPAHTTIYNALVLGTLPDGLTFEGYTLTAGTATFTPMPDGTTDASWNIGDYTNSTDDPVTITLTVSVHVDDKYTGGSDVKSGDVFQNPEGFAWDDADSGGTQHSLLDAPDTLTVREPACSITKIADNPTPQAGDTVTYTISVKNNGNWPACDTKMTDPVDPRLAYVAGSITGPGTDETGAPSLAWDAGTILPSDTVTLTYKAVVSGGITSGTVVPNTASLSYDGGEGQYGRGYSATAGAEVTARAASLSLAKTVTAGANPDWGDTVTYRVAVTNNGDGDAIGVKIADTMPEACGTYLMGSSSITWPGGSSTAEPTTAAVTLHWDPMADLAPGELMVLTFNMLVGEGVAYGTKTNSATASADDAAGTALPTSTGTADIDVKQHPEVEIVKTLEDIDHFVPEGAEFKYMIDVTNKGNTVLPAVPVVDTYDSDHLEFVSATVEPTSVTAGRVEWTSISAIPLSPAATASVEVTFRAVAQGSTPDTDNTAAISTVDDQGNPVSGSVTNTDLVITAPLLSVTKTLNESDGIVPVGAGFSYNLHIENIGSTAIVAPVEVFDRYDATQMEFVSASISPDGVTAGEAHWADVSAGTGISQAGAIDMVVSFKALKAGTTPATDNTLEVSAHDQHGDPAAGQVINDKLTITEPELSVTKVVSPLQKMPVKVDDKVSFIVGVVNTGNTAVAAPVPLAESFDSKYMTFLGASQPPVNASSGSLKWTDITGGSGLAAGASKTIRIDFKAIKEGTAPHTTDTVEVAGCKDEHGDPVADVQADAYVNVGSNKVLGATSWFIAEGSTGGGFDTWILVQNPGKDKANVELTFATASGPREPVRMVVNPESRATVRIQDYVADDFHVSTFVKSDVPVVAERSMYWDKRFWGETKIPGNPQPYEMKAGHSNMGEPLTMGTALGSESDPANTVYFPEGATANGFDTWILLCNPGDINANIRLKLMTPQGEKDGGTLTVPARSRQTVHVDSLLPDALEVAVEVDSDQPVIAERSMYWDPNGEALQPYEMKGGHSSPGSNKLNKEWFIAEGSTKEGFETFVLVQNPGAGQAEVSASFMNDKGIIATKNVRMPAGSRYTFKVSDYVREDYHVSTKILSSQPVVAERSMYWDKRAASDIVHMREGHSATGVTVTGSLWTVPEGSTGEGFDSWVLISNPTDTDTSAQVTFMTQNGPLSPRTVELKRNSRVTLRVSDFVPNDFHVSTTVKTEGKIVVERAMYWDKRERAGIQPYEMMGGHSTTGLDP